MRNGYGKEYFDNLKIQFEGEYINGKRWNGKVYDFNGNEEFELMFGEIKQKYDIIKIENYNIIF